VTYQFSHSDIEDPGFLIQITGTYEVFKSGAEIATVHLNNQEIFPNILPNHALEISFLKQYQVTVDYDVIRTNLLAAHE
jgi:hypothetical protein